LRRLEAFREVAKQLMDRPQLDRDIFGRGDPEPIAEIRQPEWTATLYDLLTAYSGQRQQKALGQVRFAKRSVWSLAEAREVLERLIGVADDWTRLDEYLIAYVIEPSLAKTVFASSFVSALELVREGVAELHQTQAFTPIYVRKRERSMSAALPNYGGNHETQNDQTTKGGH
jgi:segregation and condensation protein A